MASPPPPPPLLLVDLGSPYAYLAAERIDGLLPNAEWRAVLLGAMFQATGRQSWATTPARADGIAEVERRAAAYGLPPIRWPEPWPSDGLLAARAATWADGQGAGRAFIREALRLHFRDGISLASHEAVEEAARRTGLDATATLIGAAHDDTKAELRRRTGEALAAGAIGVPTVIVAGDALWGDDQLERAAADASTDATSLTPGAIRRGPNR